MRTLINKTINFPNKKFVWDEKEIKEVNQVVKDASYFEIFKSALQSAPTGGWNTFKLTDLKNRLDLINKFNTASDTIVLEESEYDILKKVVENEIVINSTSMETLNFLQYLSNVIKENI